MVFASPHARRLAAVSSASLMAVAPAVALATPASASSPLYRVTPIVSDQPGMAPARDRELVNAWGMSQGPSTPVWVSDNGTGVSTLYSLAGSTPKVPLTVHIPGGEPTGQVFSGDATAFPLPTSSGPQPARFLFVTESGRLSAWSPTLPITTNSTTGELESRAIREFVNPTAVFKGLAIAGSGTSARLYAADFHNNRIDMWDPDFNRIRIAHAFTDPNLPSGYAPFNVQAFGTDIYVTYAKQDAERHDDAAGPHRGFVDVYDVNGQFQKRLISRGALDSPWGLAMAPAGFGRFSGDLLVGNFGDGLINAYDPMTGAKRGTLQTSAGVPVRIDGLWALMFGNGTTAPTTSLLFTAGPDHEAHGLFGTITTR